MYTYVKKLHQNFKDVGHATKAGKNNEHRISALAHEAGRVQRQSKNHRAKPIEIFPNTHQQLGVRLADRR